MSENRVAGDGPAIEARGLVKVYGQTRALDGIDLTVRRGQVFGFLGPNGAGKPDLGIRHFFVFWVPLPCAEVVTCSALKF
jgi:ABC-type transporter Mla maintaining outer membrane lipid asymmetry ATPase subunit MlaF